MKILLLLSFLSLWRRSDQTEADPIRVVEDEGEDVVLPCSSHESIRQKIFNWKRDKDRDKMEVFLYSKGAVYSERRAGQDEAFKGRVSHFPEQLDMGNASIIIRASRVSDSGTYTCIIPDPKPQRESNVELIIKPILRSRPDVTGSAPKPHIRSLEVTKDWTLLECEVQGASPKPVVQWQNRAGDVLDAEEPQVSERGGKHDVILRATVTKTDHYRCVATQEEIHHQTHEETHVYVGGADGIPVWAVVALGVGAVSLALLVVLGVVLGVVVHKMKTNSKPDQVGTVPSERSPFNSG